MWLNNYKLKVYNEEQITNLKLWGFLDYISQIIVPVEQLPKLISFFN